jgi:hypothetical protein
MKIAVKGIDKEMARIKNVMNAAAIVNTFAKAHDLKEDLKEATPVDTGEARDGWEVVQTGPKEFSLVNDVEHIKYLNAGSSEQAPAFFIERTILENKGVVPNGAIVEYR